MTTIIEQSVKKIVDDLLEDQKWASALSDYLLKMNRGYFGWHQEVIVQKWGALPLDVYDAYGFAAVHTMMTGGKIAMAAIHLGQRPKADRLVDENNNILKTLPLPFGGEFWGGTQDEDGVISVSQEIELEAHDLDSGSRQLVRVLRDFPLEVGYVSAAKVLLYLNSPVGCVARWPYGSETVYLLHKMNTKEQTL